MSAAWIEEQQNRARKSVKAVIVLIAIGYPKFLSSWVLLPAGCIEAVADCLKDSLAEDQYSNPRKSVGKATIVSLSIVCSVALWAAAFTRLFNQRRKLGQPTLRKRALEVLLASGASG